MEIESAQLLVHRHYDDIGEWGREVGWDFGCEQAESGRMSAFAAAAGTSDCLIMRGEFSHSFRQVGSPPAGMVTLGLPDQEVTEFDWCSKPAQGGDTVNFSLASGFDGTTPAGFAGFAVSISEDLLHETASDLQIREDTLSLIRKQSGWNSARLATRTIRQQFSINLEQARGQGRQRTKNAFCTSTASRILQLISGNNSTGRAGGLAERSRATRLALDYIDDNNSASLSVAELCRHTGVSAPTLYRGFEEQFGVGPKRFMLVQCLCGVRKELLNAEPDLSISDIANHWDFWHMGQFAAEYRKCFGELPSQTRGRST